MKRECAEIAVVKNKPEIVSFQKIPALYVYFLEGKLESLILNL